MSPSTVTIAFYVALEGLSFVISFILLVTLLSSRDPQNPSSRNFSLMLIFNMGVLLSSIITWLVNGQPGAAALLHNQLSTFGLYAFWYLLRASMFLYLLACLRPHLPNTQPYKHFAYGVTLLFLILLIIAQFTPLFYYFDEQNVFQHYPLFWMAYLPGHLLYLPELLLLFKYRKKLDPADFKTLITYNILTMLAGALQGEWPYFLPLNTANTLSLLILYVRIQQTLSRRFKEQELELTESRIDIMLSQIQPHFLFNTLNTIESLIGRDPTRAEELVRDFALYLRDNMDALRQKELVPFQRELTHMDIYLDIEKARFKERLNLCCDFEAIDFFVPILTIQPLVENAVRHGVLKKPEGGTVALTTRREADMIRIIVKDDGVGFDPDKPPADGRSHVGIENVRNRLAVQCGGTLTLESKPGEGTTATVTLPQKETAHESPYRR